MKNILKPKEMSELLGVSVKTLQRWDQEGKLTAYRNPSGRRYYTKEQYEEYTIGIQTENKVGKTAIYLRITSSDDENDLNRKLHDLQNYAESKDFSIKVLDTINIESKGDDEL